MASDAYNCLVSRRGLTFGKCIDGLVAADVIVLLHLQEEEIIYESDSKRLLETVRASNCQCLNSDMNIPNTVGDESLAKLRPIEGPTTIGNFDVDENVIAGKYFARSLDHQLMVATFSIANSRYPNCFCEHMWELALGTYRKNSWSYTKW